MSLSTPKPQSKIDRSMNEMLQLPERHRNRGGVINNDWVPATQFSTMNKPQPVRRAGPLRLQWYLSAAKRLIARRIVFTRSST